MSPNETADRPTPVKRRTSRLLEWSVIAVVLATTVGLFKDFFTPMGRGIPSDGPNEDNRVYHPFGFSIVAPKNWRSRIYVADGQADFLGAHIGLHPGGNPPRRYSASFGVVLFANKPKDLDKFSQTEFQGKPAFERSSSSPDQGFENPAQSSYDLAFERDGDWFRISFHAFAEHQTLPREWRTYFDSFQIHVRPERHSDAE